MALALAGQGAGGSSFEQIKNVLHLEGDKEAIAKTYSDAVAASQANKGGSTLEIANKVYVKNGYQIKPKFEVYAVKSFDSEIQNLEFSQNVEAANTINQWVERKTNSKIKDLIKSDYLDADTRLVLVNAIYFKGTWEHQFNKNLTQKGPFYTDATNSIETDFMFTKKSFDYGRIDEVEASVLEMRYADSDVSFLIILPDKNDGLKEMESKLGGINLGLIRGKMRNVEVELTLPKFKIEHEIQMNDLLAKV